MLNWADNTYFVFDFDKLNIMVQSTSNSKNVARLPLWDQAQLQKQGAGILANRISIMWATDRGNCLLASKKPADGSTEEATHRFDRLLKAMATP